MEQNLKYVFFDLDNTLIDTEVIKCGLYEIAVKYGHSKEEARAIYQQVRAQNGVATFTLPYFKSFLENTKQCNESEVWKGFEEIVKTSVLPGVKDLLESISNSGLEMYIMSLGVPSWQEDKLRMSGLLSYFDEQHRVFVLNTDPAQGKACSFCRAPEWKSNGSNAIFFNDKPDESTVLLEKFPKLRLFLRVEKKDDRYSQKDFNEMKRKFGDRIVISSSMEGFLKFFN